MYAGVTVGECKLTACLVHDCKLSIAGVRAFPAAPWQLAYICASISTLVSFYNI